MGRTPPVAGSSALRKREPPDCVSRTDAQQRGSGWAVRPVHRWKPVREVLDFSDEGESIFGRKKPLVDATLERIYAGLIKFVAGGKEAFMVKWNSMSRAGKYHAPGIGRAVSDCCNAKSARRGTR